MGGDRGTLHQLLWWLSTRKPRKRRIKEMGPHLKVSKSDKPRGPDGVPIYLETYSRSNWTLETRVSEKNPSVGRVGKGIKRLNP